MRKLKIFLGEKDKCKGYPMYEYILKICKEMDIVGATVYKGIMGYGKKKHIHRNDFFSLSGDLPIIIEIYDKKEKIEELRNEINKLPFDGLIATQDVEVIYKEKK